MASVRTGRAPAVSLVLPSAGGIVDVFTADGQGYIREVQKESTPWLISVAGFRWHNRVSREFLLQFLRYLSIARGGVFAHWDALALRSQKSNNVDELAKKFSMSHAHAAANHQARICDMIKTPVPSIACWRPQNAIYQARGFRNRRWRFHYG